MSRCVAKVGGSLYDLPDLAGRLRRWIDACAGDHIVLVPGGGATADVVRALDRCHHLGAEASHWLAIASLSLNARFLKTLVPAADLVADPRVRADRVSILDAEPFFRADDASSGALPHRWDVTSDSLAVRAAEVAGADELVLLKSVDWPGGDGWECALAAGVVDRYFHEALANTRGRLRVSVENLRGGRWS